MYFKVIPSLTRRNREFNLKIEFLYAVKYLKGQSLKKKTDVHFLVCNIP